MLPIGVIRMITVKTYIYYLNVTLVLQKSFPHKETLIEPGQIITLFPISMLFNHLCVHVVICLLYLPEICKDERSLFSPHP